jgi:hypothetical protein
MKTLIFTLTLVFCLSACTKDPFLIPSSEIPKWLQEKITQDEKTIKTDPESGPSITAWIRYKYDNSYYFEYHNMVWSSGPWYYDFYGNKLIFSDNPAFFQDYNSNKCCKQYVWRGTNYIGD